MTQIGGFIWAAACFLLPACSQTKVPDDLVQAVQKAMWQPVYSSEAA